MNVTGHFGLSVFFGALGVSIVGLMFERGLLNRVYNAELLIQILLCYSIVLILDDLVMIIWGDEFLSSIGVPEIFQVPPLFVLDAVIPPFHLAIIGISLLVALSLWLLMTKTRFGHLVRAAAVNPKMLEALGINTTVIRASVFVLGSFLAGLGGALASSIGSVVSSRVLYCYSNRRNGINRRSFFSFYNNWYVKIIWRCSNAPIYRWYNVFNYGFSVDTSSSRSYG